MDLFAELVRLYGLPVALLLGALLICGRVVMVLWKDNQALWKARLADKDKELQAKDLRIEHLEHQRDLAMGLAEAGTLTTRSLIRRSPAPTDGD